jgi:hypothetical protein
MKVSFTSLEEAWSSEPLTSHSPLSTSNSNKNKQDDGLPSTKKKVDFQKWYNFIHEKPTEHFSNGSSSMNTLSHKLPMTLRGANATRNPNYFGDSYYDEKSEGSSEDLNQNRMNEIEDEDFVRKLTIPEECTEHLQHFVDCTYCNKMIKRRIENFMNQEKKDYNETIKKMYSKIMKKHTKNKNNKHKESTEMFDNNDNESINSDNRSERSETTENFSVISEEYGKKQWTNYIGEITFIVLIGILFIYFIDFIVELLLKWKKL